MKRFFIIVLVFCMLFALISGSLAAQSNRETFIKGYEDFLKRDTRNKIY